MKEKQTLEASPAYRLPNLPSRICEMPNVEKYSEAFYQGNRNETVFILIPILTTSKKFFDADFEVFFNKCCDIFIFIIFSTYMLTSYASRS